MCCGVCHSLLWFPTSDPNYAAIQLSSELGNSEIRFLGNLETGQDISNKFNSCPCILPVSRKGVVFLLTVIILSSVFWSPRFHFLKHLVLSNSFIIIFSPSTYSSPQHLRKYSFKPFKSSKATLHLFSSPLPCHYHHQKSYYAFHGPHTLVSLQKLSKFSTTSS